VAESLGASVDAILDGGPCAVGLESTVVDASGDTAVLLREGGVSRETLVNAAGQVDMPPADGAISSPGMLSKHYAPDCSVRMNVADVRSGEALLAFGQTPLHARHTLNLSPSGDLVEAAANLFRCLHILNALKPRGIAVTPIPNSGIGRAINDRLRRAASD
jgi:L-threonylcarbamoyladenylate synthase